VPKLFRWIATLGPVGSSPLVPATVASAAVAGAGYFLPAPPLWLTALLLAGGTALAVHVCGVAEAELGHDAKPIVADEAVGMTLALLGVPRHPVAFAAAFLLFRLMDVWKPLGARAAQRLPGGMGVVADDVLAGIYACAAYHGLAALSRLEWITRP
jgi:phosphatidylglycerophosphatase A